MTESIVGEGRTLVQVTPMRADAPDGGGVTCTAWAWVKAPAVVRTDTFAVGGGVGYAGVVLARMIRVVTR
jgi:hypothetical protein